MADEKETGIKWWVRYVVVPLIGGGGIIALIVSVREHPAIPTATNAPISSAVSPTPASIAGTAPTNPAKGISVASGTAKGNASIPCGEISPGLYVMAHSDMNTTNGGDRSIEFLPLAANKPVSARTDESFPHNGNGAATAIFQAECSQIVSSPTNAITMLDISGSLNAKCGDPSGTGNQPGGGAAIYPKWRTTLDLPKTQRKWTVKAAVANNLAELQKNDVSCAVSLDVQSRTFTVGQSAELSFDPVESGQHPLKLICSGPPDGPPWHRGYDQCLGPKGINKPITVTLPIKITAEHGTGKL